MRRRILVTVMAVTVVAVATFFVPAAVAIRSRDAQSERLDVQREAAVAVAAIDPAHPADAELPVAPGHQYGLYDDDLERIAGDGPTIGDEPVRAAFTQGDDLEQLDGRLIATLLVDDHDGRGQAVVLRVAESADEATDATRRAVGGLALGALGILVAAGLVAYALTIRLTRPIDSLRTAAGRLGSGDFTTAVAPTGVAELDEVGSALTLAGERIGTAMARERAFSADASHQLRTPLTAMRAAIETEQLAPRADPARLLDELLVQTDRLESIVDSLLTLARETHQHRNPTDLGSTLDAAAGRWAAAARDAGRELVVDRPDEAVWTTASPVAVDHILDVLVDNSLRHGAGPIRLGLASIGSGCRVTVADEGRVADGVDLFERRASSATGTGIGLHLARSLTESEGGRLRLADPAPTTFELTLPGAAPGG